MFRIEYAFPRSSTAPNLWWWSVKVPTGLYEVLATNEKGRGLYIQRVPGPPLGSPFQYTQLLAEDEFSIPENVTKDQAIDLLEAALNKLGWDEDFLVLLSTFRPVSLSMRKIKQR